MRNLLFTLLLAIAVVLPYESSAQIDLGKALGILLGEGTTVQQQPRSPLEEIAEKAPEAKDLVQTWAYDRLFLKYLGTHPLADAALQQVNMTAQAALKNAGLVSGSFTFTIRRNGTCFIMHEGEALDGTYSYVPEKGRVTLNTAYGGQQYTSKGFFTMEGKILTLMVDARDVLNLVLAIYPEYRNDPNLQTIEGILAQFKGVYVCLDFRR